MIAGVPNFRYTGYDGCITTGTATYTHSCDPSYPVYRHVSKDRSMLAIRIDFWMWISMFTFRLPRSGRRILTRRCRCDKEIKWG